MSQIRKSVVALTLADLRAHPVWEFALDEEGEEGQDETTVRPYPHAGEVDPSEGLFVVAADFRFANGASAAGYVYVTALEERDDMSSVQPVVVTADGQVGFWFGMIEPAPEHIAASYQRLGKSGAAKVFPLAFTSVPPLANGPVKGQVPGFMSYVDLASRRIRLQK
jgi:hypothetical protein